MRITEWNRAENRADIAQAIPLRSARQFDPVLLRVSLLWGPYPARPFAPYLYRSISTLRAV